MEALPLAFTTGWASGINAYACVLILGLLGRFAGADDVPAALTSNTVLIAAGVLFAFEFVADKIPYVDSAWDAISTVIRPTIGVVSLAAFHPEAALIIAGILLALGLIGTYFALRFIRRGYLRFRAWREKRRAPATRSSAVSPGWGSGAGKAK